MSQNMLDMSHVGYDIKSIIIFTYTLKVLSPQFTPRIILQISHLYCLSQDALSPELFRKAVHYEL